MYEELQDINAYLSIKNESEEEQIYLTGLYSQYITATESGSYHLALFAYHLLFMSYVYQTIYKIKEWCPEKFKLALITSSKQERDQYLEAKSCWIFSKIRERTIFSLIHILADNDELVEKCKKKIIDYRNEKLGHANPIMVGDIEFNQKIEEYNQIADEIQQMTHEKLCVLFQEFTELFEDTDDITKDDLELNLIIINRLSEKDLECLATECTIKNSTVHNKIKDVLTRDYGIEITVI